MSSPLSLSLSVRLAEKTRLLWRRTFLSPLFCGGSTPTHNPTNISFNMFRILKNIPLNLSALGTFTYCQQLSISKETRCNSLSENPSASKIYRASEVAKHTSASDGIWVTYKDGVYDITRFVANHPGGSDKIVMAAGKSVEPFWRIYRQHYNSKLALEVLGPLRIGTLHPDDVAAESQMRDKSDPYCNDPCVSPVMRILQDKPINAESPANLLSHEWYLSFKN